MRLGVKRRIITGVVTAALVTTMAAPVYAADVIALSSTGYQIGDTIIIDTPSSEPAFSDDLPIESAFSDVQTSDWYFPYVMTLYKEGGVSGVGDNRFNPNGTVTAAEFIAIAARLVVPEKIDTRSAPEHWAYPYYDALKSVRILNGRFSSWKRSSGGYAESGSGLSAPVRRYEMAEVLVELAEYRGETIQKKTNIENNLNDSAKCTYDVLRAYSAGLLTGKDNGNFDPKGNMTRAEMCVVFCRLMNYVSRPSVIVQSEKQSEYFVTAPGETKGMLKPDYARKFDLEALSKVYIGEDSKGVYISVTAPELPSELSGCTFGYLAEPINAQDNYFTDIMRITLNPGESSKQYFVSYQDTSIRASQIAYMEVLTWVNVPDCNRMLTHRADTTSKTKVLEKWHYGDYSAIDFDVSHIFKGINK